jgi:glyoxylase-like metal-dependent hydrolase (beta-lactamase superfamily II)
MKLFAIEGNTQRLDGGAMFGNAPKAVWEGWAPPDEKNRITLACRALLLQTDDKRNILFETGIGAFFEPKMRDRYGVVEPDHVLLQNLKAVGLSENDIDVVVLSHLHFDHAGGMLSGFDGNPPHLLFPRARIYVGKEHWNRANHPHARDRASFVPELNQLLAASNRMVLVDSDGRSDLSPLIDFQFTDGHTVGLMLSKIHLESGPIVFCSDLIPGVPWVHLPITMGYDRFAEQLIDEKRVLLENLITEHGKLFFTHDARVACGVLKRDDKGKFYAVAVNLEELH